MIGIINYSDCKDLRINKTLCAMKIEEKIREENRLHN